MPGALFIATAIACVPSWLIARNFDRNAAPQFVALSISAVVLGSLFVVWKERVNLPRFVLWGMGALLATCTVSLFTSHNIISGLTGDTGRYTGLISLIALLLIALFFSQLSDNQFSNFYPWLLAGISIVNVLGLMQAWGWFTMPGDGGVGSTLGNLDFLAAWMGTGFPLYFWRRIRTRTAALSVALIFILSLWIMVKISAKQGIIDFILLIPMALIYIFRDRINLPILTVKIWTGIGTFVTVLWLELIYLIPMAKLPIPGISGDSNVRIRTDFWFAGFQQFSHHLLFGVGPDNYGNYYEKYRSLSSVQLTEGVLSNDAHSAVVQTFATLGILGILAFLILLIMYIRGLVVMIQTPSHRWIGSIAAVFSLIYLTNSAVSPITLPNKFMFWAVAGYVIGASQRLRPLLSISPELPVRIVAGVLTATVLFVSVNFAVAQLRFLSNGDKYQASPYLPCTIYFGQELAKGAKTADQALAMAKAKAGQSPRCIEAQSILASAYLNANNLKAAKKPIYALIEIAPGRKEVVRLASIYALRAKDLYLQQYLVSQGLKLGVLTQG